MWFELCKPLPESGRMRERLLIRNPADGCVVPKVQHQEMKTLRSENLKVCLDAEQRILKELLRFHDLRHAFATLALQN